MHGVNRAEGAEGLVAAQGKRACVHACTAVPGMRACASARLSAEPPELALLNVFLAHQGAEQVCFNESELVHLNLTIEYSGPPLC